MAVTLTAAELAAALRVGDSAEETAEATRLLAYGTAAVERQAPDAPPAVQNEALIRLCAYLYDSPTANRGTIFANAMRNSGAAHMLSPYLVRRAGTAS